MFSWETPPAASGGRAAHVDGLAHALADAGHDVVVITRRTQGLRDSQRLARYDFFVRTSIYPGFPIAQLHGSRLQIMRL